MAKGARGVVGPDDCRPASADFCGIGFQRGVGAKEGDLGVLNVGIPALVITAHFDSAATVGARNIDAGLIHDCHAVAEHLDIAACCSGGNDTAGAIDVGVLTGLEEDTSAFTGHT